MAKKAAELVRRYDGRVRNEFSHFVLFDFFDHTSPIAISTSTDPDWVGQSGAGGAVFHTTDSNLEVLATVELWSGSPLDLDDPEAHSYTGTFTCSSGKVILASVTGGPHDVVIDLPGAGEYHVQAVRLPEFVATSLDDEDLCEQWRIRVWQ